MIGKIIEEGKADRENWEIPNDRKNNRRGQGRPGKLGNSGSKSEKNCPFVSGQRNFYGPNEKHGRYEVQYTKQSQKRIKRA